MIFRWATVSRDFINDDYATVFNLIRTATVNCWKKRRNWVFFSHFNSSIKLTFTNWILSRPVSIRQTLPRAVANQIPAFCASELCGFTNKSFTGINYQIFIDIRHWAGYLNTDWCIMSPCAIFRAQSSRHTIEFEFRKAFVECSSSVVCCVSWQRDGTFLDWWRILTVNICKKSLSLWNSRKI